jgi:hypothetical protein
MTKNKQFSPLFPQYKTNESIGPHKTQRARRKWGQYAVNCLRGSHVFKYPLALLNSRASCICYFGYGYWVNFNSCWWANLMLHLNSNRDISLDLLRFKALLNDTEAVSWLLHEMWYFSNLSSKYLGFPIKKSKYYLISCLKRYNV